MNLIWFCGLLASVSHPLRGWGCAFHPVCWSSHPRKSSAALRSPSSPNHHTTCDDGRHGPMDDAWWCYVCWNVFNMLFLGHWKICWNVLPSIDFHRFSMDFRCSIPKRLLPVDSPPDCHRMPQDAAGCRWPDDWMVSWIDHLPFLGPRVRVTRIIQILAADLRMRSERAWAVKLWISHIFCDLFRFLSPSASRTCLKRVRKSCFWKPIWQTHESFTPSYFKKMCIVYIYIK